MGRNKELNRQMKDQRKAQLISSALKLFSAQGLAGTKISDIAADAGFSQGLVYHYFKSKDEIFIDIIRTAFVRMNEAVKGLESLDMAPLKKIELAYGELVKNIIENDNASRFHLLIAVSSTSTAVPEKAKEIIVSEYKIPYEAMESIMEQGQSQGSIINKSTKDLSLLFWSTINGLAIYRAAHGKTFETPDPEIFMNMFKK